MDVIVSETNKKKKCLIYDGFTFRVDRILKNNDISWRCTNNKRKCKARVRTDGESKVVMSAISEHNHDMNERKIESKQLRDRVMAKRKASDDISARPSKIIRQELQKLDESNLQTKDLIFGCIGCIPRASQRTTLAWWRNIQGIGLSSE